MPSHCPETGPSSLSLDANSPRTGHFNPFFQTLGFLIPPPRDFQRGVQRHVRGMWAGSQASSLTTAPPPPRETLQSPRRTEDEGARRPRRSGQGGGLRATPTGGRGLADPGLNGVTASSWGVQRLSGSSFSVAGHRPWPLWRGRCGGDTEPRPLGQETLPAPTPTALCYEAGRSWDFLSSAVSLLLVCNRPEPRGGGEAGASLPRQSG